MSESNLDNLPVEECFRRLGHLEEQLKEARQQLNARNYGEAGEHLRRVQHDASNCVIDCFYLHQWETRRKKAVEYVEALGRQQALEALQSRGPG